ncbi:hypothetical protein [Leisingera sp. ANG-Vp]|uniref:hypothetical protein n=1 Tax=Leisingera sp. ANG-Vp TaxID=1577896 RepID=UPI00126A2B9A|nr:hypothetical protein [Leisingera sp. ANG-Vp]
MKKSAVLFPTLRESWFYRCSAVAGLQLKWQEIEMNLKSCTVIAAGISGRGAALKTACPSLLGQAGAGENMIRQRLEEQRRRPGY